jgi:hypothetical protein
VVEELGVALPFDAATGDRPFFLTVTETTGHPASRHTDVSLWFALSGRRGMRLTPDEREFRAVRWWTPDELAASDPAGFEPHLSRALAVLWRARQQDSAPTAGLSGPSGPAAAPESC